MLSNLSQTHFLRFHLILVLVLFDSPWHQDLMHTILIQLRKSQYLGLGTLFLIIEGDPLVSLDFFENPMAHPRMKVQVLGSLKLPLAKKKIGEKSVDKHDF